MTSSATSFLASNNSATKKEPQGGHGTNDQVDDQSGSTILAERADDNTKDAERQHKPVDPAQQRNQAQEHEDRGEDTTEGGDDLHDV